MKGASTDQAVSKARDGAQHTKPTIIWEIEKEIDEMLVKLVLPFCKFFFAEIVIR